MSGVTVVGDGAGNPGNHVGSQVAIGADHVHPSGRPSPTLFADADNVTELLGLFAGAASMCWEHVDLAGEFDSQRASELVDAVVERLIELGWV